MLERTFQHVPGIGPGKERELWEKGIVSWSDFEAAGLPGLLVEPIWAAREALEARNLEKLAKLLPNREHWRLYPEFSHEALFFDIEADEKQKPTVVSLYDGETVEVFVAGQNIQELPKAMARKRLWVTFNGSVHDVPILKKCFSTFPRPYVHVDLRFFCLSLQISGGLKAVEAGFELKRPNHVAGVTGRDAVFLWKAFCERRDQEALRLLVEYNLYDAVHLKAVLEKGFNVAVHQRNFETPRLTETAMDSAHESITRWIENLVPGPRDNGALDRIRESFGAPERTINPREAPINKV